MSAGAFNYRRNRRQQIVDKGTAVDNDVSFRGKRQAFQNMFVNRMKDTNKDYRTTDPGGFDNITASEAADSFLDKINYPGPNFGDENKDMYAEEFIDKYDRSGFYPPEEKVNRSIIDRVTDYFSERLPVGEEGGDGGQQLSQRIQTPPLPPTNMPAPNLMAQSPQKINGLTRSEQALLSPEEKIIAART